LHATKTPFRWGGCSDNVHYGVAFTRYARLPYPTTVTRRRFVDATERAKKQPLARMLVNLHNIEAGRQALLQHMRLQCKCHGVSGSCAMRSCYKKMPSFREVGYCSPHQGYCNH